MKTLLLGATGQLGREWQDYLNRIQQGLELKTYSSRQLDLTQSAAVQKELRRQQPDLVINCAAFTDVDGAEEQQDLAKLVNAGAVAHLAKLSAELGFRLIHYSTDYVFPGRKEDRQHLLDGYPEDHPADPINAYGQTKWEGEQAIRNAADDYLILRVSWLCGQYGSNFVKTMLRLGREREELQVVNDQWGCPSFARHVVETSYSLLQEGKNGTWHVTSSGLISWYEFAKAIFSMAHIDINVEPVTSGAFPTKAKRPQFSKLSTQKLSSHTSIAIPDWREELKDLLAQLDDPTS